MVCKKKEIKMALYFSYCRNIKGKSENESNFSIAIYREMSEYAEPYYISVKPAFNIVIDEPSIFAPIEWWKEETHTHT